MSQRLLEKIRNAILFGDYDLTHHAIDEMAEDGLGIFDIEHTVVTPESFPLSLSIQYLAMIIVGGLGTVQGTLYGTVFVTRVPDGLRSLTQLAQRISPEAMTWFYPKRDIVFGAMIVGFLVFEPHGLAEIVNRIRRFFALWPFPK